MPNGFHGGQIEPGRAAANVVKDTVGTEEVIGDKRIELDEDEVALLFTRVERHPLFLLASVARGESYVAEVGPGSNGSVGTLSRAKELFEQVIDDPASDDATLAGAYAGLGACIFNSAAAVRIRRGGAPAKALPFGVKNTAWPFRSRHTVTLPSWTAR